MRRTKFRAKPKYENSFCYNSFAKVCFENFLFLLRYSFLICPVGWGCRIHRLHLCRGVRLPPNECPRYDTKQSDGEVPVMLEPGGMQSTLSLPSLPGSLWPIVVAPDKGPIYWLNRTKLHTWIFVHMKILIFCLSNIAWTNFFIHLLYKDIVY